MIGESRRRRGSPEEADVHQRVREVQGLLWAVWLPLVMAGCGAAERLPTTVPEPASRMQAATPEADAPSMAAPGRWRARSPVAEARRALGAVLTGEQAYLQRWGTFTVAADTTEIRTKLGVYLDEPSRRWIFSVGEATSTGFVASARGRDHTAARGIVVTLRYERGQPLRWTVERHRRTPPGHRDP
jgi:hypothetical protein